MEAGCLLCQVLAGRIGEAIGLIQQLYPGLLRNNEDLHFRLKVRLVAVPQSHLESTTVSQFHVR
jgi:hypothetical protein